MKLQATVTALRTNGRVELTIVTSATGLEQTITADNEGYALNEALTILVLRQDETEGLLMDLTFLDAQNPEPLFPRYANQLREQLRPDPPPPWETTVTKMKPPKPTCNGNRTGYHTCGLPIGGCQLPQPDDATTQEFRLGGTV